jgi:hypothetical protein
LKKWNKKLNGLDVVRMRSKGGQKRSSCGLKQLNTERSRGKSEWKGEKKTWSTHRKGRRRDEERQAKLSDI